ncbi:MULTISPECIES: tight adherence pilus pseudopilin TadF [Pasteurellaceae]|uniref:Tight adherence pilus pseudopilin TadF n=1 Tax=Pasteurella atlantica TaxID=2827233 RepID=A0AAW8CQ97_9PAST|nr:tight adherence pilus pseudopilin TadF [Pasteurella atlantica]MBR0573537.1 protein TadF [Pasteurella atlantica]MDP8039604.1 tight adherence pilus pseudopilin TadF [Pasteurella atlantica]MDP8041695.1 tight adherence pilus pseudopilin TadF [Pasteurella atlantica]MDP8043830.1 tight adherence pilus pseudopilin TadF [Pasteurella atlantica]MDP8045916.1 tight adherence pilus pseudopilin TadF [Pasteurella atlantica]
MKDRNLRNKLFNNFTKNSRGSVTIEFVFMITLLTLMLVFMVDLALLRSNLGKIDNATYSLVNLLRERTQLYGKGNESLSKDEKVNGKIKNKDLSDFRRLAKYMMYGDANSSKELFIIIESLQFNEADVDKEPTLVFSSLGDRNACVPATNLQLLRSIAPRSEVNERRTIPLYQVTICIQDYSIFRAIILDESEKSGRLLRSSSVAVGR